MRTVKFYLDADISRVSLRKGLLKAGIDVSWTPNDWMPENASDQMQLQEASLRGRCLVTHNIADFYRLHVERPDHEASYWYINKDGSQAIYLEL